MYLHDIECALWQSPLVLEFRIPKLEVFLPFFFFFFKAGCIPHEQILKSQAIIIINNYEIAADAAKLCSVHETAIFFTLNTKR